MKARRLDYVAACLRDLNELTNDKYSMALLKKLEAFKEECETYGVYTEDKSLAQLRWDLRQAKAFEVEG